MPHYVLLLGAGFSRNWGGWLASEAFEYLLGCPLVNESARALLWRFRRQGGFEETLANLQADVERNRNPTTEKNLLEFERAILQMFRDMDKAFAGIESLEFHNNIEYLIRTCFVRFDAIFTLNQDLLMERHYLTGSVFASSRFRSWAGFQIPGTQELPIEAPHEMAKRSPDKSKFVVEASLQPFFKLHGSSNWIDETSGRPLLIMGANKPFAIQQHPVLKWNHERLREYLSRADTRLMVIGYSFGDDHINNLLREAVGGGTLRLFIIDPLGLDVLDRRRDSPTYSPANLLTTLQPHLIGASRRSMREIFGGDLAEHAKVMRFFD